MIEKIRKHTRNTNLNLVQVCKLKTLLEKNQTVSVPLMSFIGARRKTPRASHRRG